MSLVNKARPSTTSDVRTSNTERFELELSDGDDEGESLGSRTVTRMDIVNSNTRSKWLNDDAFTNFYMALWSQHVALRTEMRQQGSVSAFFVQTYFHKTLSSKGYEGVKKWSQKKGEHGFEWLDCEERPHRRPK
tara:strand:+ start:275 stop:676 length:402 start_codon:yes stop_codon:yes gene_type:complete